ncbi:MAG: MlaD family protein [PVC group bacterium]
MSQKTNYFKLGLFVIIAVVILLVGLFFLGAREMFRKEWTFETYIDSSVQGLDIGSPVKMMGVKIGSVSQIKFVYEMYETEHNYVYVLFTIDPSAIGAKLPDQGQAELKEKTRQVVDHGLRLTLASQGITGICFLDASYYDLAKIEELKIDWTPEHPYIPAVPGTLARLSSSLEKTLDSLAEVDFAAVGEKVNQTLASVKETLEEDIRPMLVNLREEASPTLANLREASDSVPEITAHLNVTLQRLSDWVSEQKGSLSEVIEDVRSVSDNLRQLTESARQDPSHILWGKPPPPSKVIESP